MPENVLEGFRLSTRQLCIWDAIKNEPGSHYHVARFEIEGNPEGERIRLALAKIAQRHEIFRTAFIHSPEITAPIQSVGPAGRFDWETVGFEGHAESVQRRAIQDISLKLRRADTGHGRLRAVLVMLSPQRATLLLAAPIMASDVFTFEPVLKELALLYQPREDSWLAEPPVQFAQFAEWQNSVDAEFRPEIPPDPNSRDSAWLPFSNENAGKSLPCFLQTSFDGELSVLLDASAARQGMSPSLLLLAAWSAFLFRLSARLPISIFCLASDRDDPELEDMCGPCSSYRHVALSLDEGTSFQNVTEALEPALGDTAGSGNASPEDHGFRVGFDFSTTLEAQAADGTRFAFAGCYSSLEGFQLKLSCRHSAAQTEVEFQFDARSIDSRYVGKLAQYFPVFLRDALRDSTAPIGHLQILGPEERDEILRGFNGTACEVRGQWVHELFEDQAKRTPENMAVQCENRCFTYAEISHRANRLANCLRRRGLGPETLVGVCLPSSEDLVVSLLAVLKAGAAFVPIDPSYPPERLRFIVQDCRARLVLTQHELAAAFHEMGAETLCLAVENAEGEPSGDAPVPLDRDNVAYVIYTSGSTGTPKGVAVSHGALANYLGWCLHAYPASEGQQMLVHSSISFDLTLTSIFLPLISGRCARVLAAQSSPSALADALRGAPHFSVLKLTPSHLRMLQHLLSAEEAQQAARALILGGEALRQEDLALWASQPEAVFFNEYGPTETTVGCCVKKLSAQEIQASGNVPIGRPILNSQLYVLDSELEPVPMGVPGELYIGGAGVARGYLNRPDLTAEKFIPDPFNLEGGKRLYRTGDLVRFLASGDLEYMGRLDSQVKIRGCRIEPGEIETALLQHPDVREAAVLAVEDQPGSQRLVTCLSTRSGGLLPPTALRAYLESKLPAFMLPSAFLIFPQLPLTPNLKLDRKALEKMAISQQDPIVDMTAPQTMTEEVLAGIWSQVLKLKTVGIDDNYFVLGGDSIRSIQVVARARERGLFFEVNDLFRFPTIRKLALFVDHASGAGPHASDGEPFSMISAADRLKLPEGLEDAYPVTVLQAGMIFHRELRPDSAIYHDISSFYVRAPFDQPLLNIAIHTMCARHPALRTAFDLSRYSEPLQLVHEDASLECEFVDLSSLPDSRQEASIDDFWEAEKKNGFDCTRLPLIRFWVHVRGFDRWQFTMSFHHAILDGWSEATMITEMFHDYLSMVRGTRSESPALASKFRDYVALEREALQSEQARRYWEATVQDASILTLQRLARSAGAQGTHEILIEEVPFPNEVSEGLKQLALVNAVPVKTVLLAAHMRVLSLLSGQSDVLTCVVSSGRPEGTDGDRIAGLFINSMPFRLNLKGGNWNDLVTQTFEAERLAFPHRRYPMAELKRRLNIQVLAETLFYFTHYHVYQSLEHVPGVEVLGARLYEETSFVLAANFRIDPFTNRIHFVLKCDGSQLLREQVAIIGKYYRQVLEHMAGEPEQHYGYTRLLIEEENQILSGKLDQSAAPASKPAAKGSIHSLFQEQAAQRPQATALVCEGRRLSYRELDEKSNQLAHYLIKTGAGPGDLIPLCLERSQDALIAILGTLKAGAAYVPMEIDYPPERIRYIVENTRAKAVIAHQDAVKSIPPGVETVIDLDRIAGRIAEEPTAAPPAAVSGDDPAYVIYTSGSTGAPKGVIVPHRNVVRLFEATRPWFEFDEKDVWTFFHSYAFDFSVWEIWGALLHGGRLVVVPYMVSRSPESFYELLCSEGVTILNQTPSAFRQLIKIAQTAKLQPADLRKVIFGGEALDFSSLKPWFDSRGDVQPQLINMYGITETTVHVTYQPLTREDAEAKPGSIIGIPIPDLDVYVLDSFGQPAPLGVAGELYVGGAGLGWGYAGRADLTAERFVPHPFHPAEGQRLYRTGDMVRLLADGRLEYLGRLDHQIKIRGFRIELGEIETTLQMHPGVREAVVLAREDQPGDRRLIAYLTRKSEQLLSPSELRRFLQERLPDYMLPAAFVVLDSLPLTVNGKLDRKALPAPQPTRPNLESSYVEPRNHTEEIVASILAQVLDLEQVGVHDSFFELGGHSLSATLTIAKIREAFEVNLPLLALYEGPTVEALARSVQQLQADSHSGKEIYMNLPVITPDREHRYDPFPLTEIQQAYWIGRQKGFQLGDMPAHIYLEFHTIGLDLDRLGQAVRRLIERHDMLRAVILQDGSQTILEDVPAWQIDTSDLRGIGQEVASRRILETRQQMSHQMFVTHQWPLFEIKAQLLDEGHIRLHFSIDLLVTDADSLGILNRELGELYLDPDAALPPIDLSFRDYVLTEIELRKTPFYNKSRDYQLARLDDMPPAPELPLEGDLSRLENKQFIRLRTGLDTAAWKRLKHRAAVSGITPSGVLLAAYADVLAQWSRSARFTINVTTYNCLPLHPHARRLVGDFTSLTLVAVNSSQPTFEARARSVQHQFADDLDHSYFSGISVMRELGKRRGEQRAGDMPIVFTSTLPLHTREGRRKPPFPVELAAGITQSPQTLLDHQVSEEDGALTVRWDFLSAAFPAGVVEEMFEGYRSLLQALASDEGSWQRTDRGWLLPGAQLERRAQINLTQGAAPSALLHSAFLQQAAADPQRPALLAPGLSLSYGELLALVYHYAGRLRQLQVQPNQLVALVMEKGWEQIAAALAILHSGAAYLPIDAALPQQRREQLLALAEVRVALTQPHLLDALPWPEGLQVLPLTALSAAQQQAALRLPLAALQQPSDLAYVIFTSGSTGVPKGVMISHRAALNTVADINRRFAVTAQDRVLGLSAMSFDLSVYDVFGLLAAGGALVLPPPQALRDPALWLQLIQQHAVSLWNTVPALMEMLAEHVAALPAPAPLASLRLVLLSGDWIPLSLPPRLRALAPTAQVVSLGGATEASIWSIFHPIGDLDPGWKSVPYGRPLLNQQFHVLNAALEPAPDWVPGELYIAGLGLAEGYWRDPDKTAAAFLTHPRSGQRLYRTGDLGRYRPNGDIEFLGRIDSQIKLHGHRIELGEIEAVLQQHPKVRDAVASLFLLANGSRHIAAYVVVETSAPDNSNSSTPASPILLTAASRETFKQSQPGLRSFDNSDISISMALRPPKDPDQAKTLYRQRRTHREFGTEPVSFAQISELLLTIAQARIDGKPKYRFASAGGLYPIQAYLYVKPGRVEGLEGGVYYLHPAEYSLKQMCPDATIPESIHWPSNREAFRNSAFSLFLVADVTEVRTMYGTATRDFCLIEAGMMTQLLEVAAPGLGLGMCQIGSIDFESVRPLLKISATSELLYSMAGGVALPAPLHDVELPGWTAGLGAQLTANHNGHHHEKSSLPGVTPERLQSFLRERLPEPLVPSVICILDSLPLTSNGKVDRKALPSPEIKREDDKPSSTPRSEMQKTIAGIIQKELCLDRVGLQENFFDLGATSLTMIKLHHQLQSLLSREFPIVALFRFPSVELLSRFLADQQSQEPARQDNEGKMAKRERVRAQRKARAATLEL